MSITLKDIARRVGKSVPTVSRALADHDDISPTTRQEVQRLAREMGYEPNSTARNLQKQRTDTIALVLPPTDKLRFSDPFFSEFLSGVIEQTARHGFDLNVSTHTAAEDGDQCETYLKRIRSRRVDGFIVVRAQRQDDRIALLQTHKIPFVVFGRTENYNDFHLVDEDGSAGIRQVVDHLVALGHTRLACIAEPLCYTKSYHRVQGFMEGLQAHGLPFDERLLVEANFRQRSGRLSAHQLLDMSDPPTAIVACNDLLALGAMSAAQERGLVVGREISVTGFDDILLAEYANPALTTVHQPAQQLGAMVAQMLLQIITGQALEKKQIILRPSLVVRQSSGPMRAR